MSACAWEMPALKEVLKDLLLNGLLEAQPELAGPELASHAQNVLQEDFARIRWLLAINPNTPPPVLEHLALDACIALLQRVAEHPRTRGATLFKLAIHEDAQVRAACAENVNLSGKTIWQLARDKHPDVRMRLAESYTIPPAVLRVLSEDDNPYVAHRARLTMTRITGDDAGTHSC